MPLTLSQPELLWQWFLKKKKKLSSKQRIYNFLTRSLLITLWNQITLQNIIIWYNCMIIVTSNNGIACYIFRNMVLHRPKSGTGIAIRSSCHFLNIPQTFATGSFVFICVKWRKVLSSKTKWIGLSWFIRNVIVNVSSVRNKWCKTKYWCYMSRVRYWMCNNFDL